MSQKAWMQAYSKGSKSLQARLAKIHANNPEFQEFVKKHGFGGNLSKKQAEKQKVSSSPTVKPVTKGAPEKNPSLDREAMIKAAAEKLRNRRMANANRVAFGGELGGGFTLPTMGFRTYREARELSAADHFEIEYAKQIKQEKAFNETQRHRAEVRKKMKKAFDYKPKKWAEEVDFNEISEEREYKKGDKVMLHRDYAGRHAGLIFTVHHTNANGEHWIGRGKDHRGWYVRPNQIVPWRGKKTNEDIDYKDAKLRMRRGGWIVVRDGKQQGVIHPTEGHAKAYADATRKTLGHKLSRVIRQKAKEIALGLGRMSMATESKENRERILAHDSAVLPGKKLPKLSAERKNKLINKIIAHMSNPKYSMVSKKYMNAAFKLGESEMASEKTLNELKKATLASYLSKAGGRIRSATKIAGDFEADHYKAMATANKHHPNMVTPGFEKDPEKLKKAETKMKVTGDLRDTFKRDAYNRIKGIARAGRLLTKEDAEQIDELKLNTAVRALRSMKSTADDYYASQEDQRRVTRFRNAIKRKWGEKGAEVADKVSSDSHTRQKAYDSGDMLKKKAVGADDVITRGKRKGKLRPEVQGSVKATTNLNLMKLKKQPKPNLPEEVEQLDERNTESHPSLWATHELRHESGKVLNKGDVVKGFRGTYKIQGFEMPHHEGSTGRVYTDKGSFFPSVVNAKIVKKKEPVLVRQAWRGQIGEEIEQVDEVSRSTIAKVAQARYNQAQKALKDKNYPEYVKKMQKAIKAGDATTPKTGWSYEEETQQPEGEPIVEVSAQEKYRQIRESKMRNRKGK